MPLHAHQGHVIHTERKRKSTRTLDFRGFWRSLSPIPDRRHKRVLQTISNTLPSASESGPLLPHTDADYPPKPTKRLKRQPEGPIRGPRPFPVCSNYLPVIPPQRAERDAVYYDQRSRGSQCVFLVESVLFKADTSLLMRDDSAFCNMFSLPVHEDSLLEGSSDENPIILHDTADQFRALLWVLNALPLELQLHDMDNLLPMEQLLNLAEITHKYHFQLYESWALSAIHNVITHQNTALSIAPSLFPRLISVSILSDRPETLDFVIHHLHSQIIRDRRFPLPPSLLSISRKYDIKKLIVAIMYRQLVNGERKNRRRESCQNGSFTSDVYQPSDTHDLRSGPRNAARLSLQVLWKHLSDSPPIFELGCRDTSINQVLDHSGRPCNCETEWKRIWSHACSSSPVERCDAVDVVGRLRRMLKVLVGGSGVVTTRMCVSCALAALESLEETIEDIIEHLDDHFS